MVKSKFEIVMWRILAFAIIFTQLFGYGIVLADGPGYNAQDLHNQIGQWLNDEENNPVRSYTFDENGSERVMYALNMPGIPKDSGIYYDASTYGYTYLIKDDKGNVVGKVPIEIEVICMPSDQFPTDLNSGNYSAYVDGGGSEFLEEKDGSQLKILSIDSNVPMTYAYAVRIDGGEATIYKHDTVTPKEQGKSLGEILEDAAAGIAGFALSLIRNALAEIINDLLLAIGDGIQNLVDSVMGEEENLTVYRVLFNKIEKLDINYWEDGSGDDIEEQSEAIGGEDDATDDGAIGNAPKNVLKDIVSYWYGVLTTIGICFYIAMLLYIGVRILLSSTTSSAQKYKEMLTAWGTGVIILLFFPYAMKTVVIVNDTFIDMLDTSAQTNYEEIMQKKNGGEENKKNDDPKKNLYATTSDDPMILIREQAEDDVNIALSIIYLILLGQLIVLLGVYYKRVFMMAFLIVIFPIVAVLYVWEKSNKGGGNALTTWTKEYTVLVFTQTFHAVTYVVLVKAAYEAFLLEGNWFVFMLSVVFLFNGEKIVRSIFGMKSSANTIGDLAAAGATAWAVSKSVGGLFKGDKAKATQDEKDEEEASNDVQEARRNTAINTAMSNRYNGGQNVSNASASNVSNPNVGTQQNTPQTNGGAPSNGMTQPQNNQMDNLEAARALIRQKALEKRNKKRGKGVLQKGLNVASRAAGATVGLASGLAAGSLKDGISNAVVASEITGMAGSAAGGIVGYVKGAFGGQIMRMKVRSGAMDEELRRVGFDFNGNFDSDPTLSAAKARIIRNALASEIYGTRSGGKVKGELKFVNAVEKGIKKENIH